MPTGDGEKKFKIAWDNRARDVVPVASSEAASYRVEYVTRYENWLMWMPDAGGTQTLTWDFTTDITVSVFAIAVHQLSADGGTVALQHSPDGVAWTDAVAAFTPQSDFPFWASFDAITDRYWRVAFSTTNPVPIGYVFIGESTEMERGHFVGFSPPGLNVDVETIAHTSRDGRPLGISVRDHGAMLDLELDPLTDVWTRETWNQIQVYAETGTYFIQWDDEDHAYETAYCWPMGRPDTARYNNGIYQETALSSRAMKANHIEAQEPGTGPDYTQGVALWEAEDYGGGAQWVDSNGSRVMSMDRAVTGSDGIPYVFIDNEVGTAPGPDMTWLVAESDPDVIALDATVYLLCQVHDLARFQTYQQMTVDNGKSTQGGMSLAPSGVGSSPVPQGMYVKCEDEPVVGDRYKELDGFPGEDTWMVVRCRLLTATIPDAGTASYRCMNGSEVSGLSKSLTDDFPFIRRIDWSNQQNSPDTRVNTIAIFEGVQSDEDDVSIMDSLAVKAGYPPGTIV